MTLCLQVCMYTTCVSSAHIGQLRLSDLLEVKSQMIVNHHVGAGNEPWSSKKAVIALNYEVISLVPSSNISNQDLDFLYRSLLIIIK